MGRTNFSSAAGSYLKPWILPLVIAAITYAVFTPVLGGEFLNWDDRDNFLLNEHYRGLGWAQIQWMVSTTHAGLYMPLTWLTFGLNFAVSGMNPFAYHLTSLLLHALNAAVFYVVAKRLLTAALRGSPGADEPPTARAIVPAASVAALLFALHPQRVEPVAWITDRGTLLSGLFYLLAVLAYLRAVEDGAGVKWRWWGSASVAAFSAAVLSKGIAMTLPISLLVLDAYPLGRARGRWRGAVVEKVPYFVVAALGATAAIFARSHWAPLTGLVDYGVGARAALAAYSFWFYPLSFVWPLGLSPLYELPASVDLIQWRFLGPLLGVGVVTASAVLLRHRFPAGLATWVHSVAAVAPVSGVLHSGIQLAADRYAYLAGFGFALLAGACLLWIVRQRSRGRVRTWVVVAAGDRRDVRDRCPGGQYVAAGPSLAELGSALALGHRAGWQLRALPWGAGLRDSLQRPGERCGAPRGRRSPAAGERAAPYDDDVVLRPRNAPLAPRSLSRGRDVAPDVRQVGAGQTRGIRPSGARLPGAESTGRSLGVTRSVRRHPTSRHCLAGFPGCLCCGRRAARE